MLHGLHTILYGVMQVPSDRASLIDIIIEADFTLKQKALVLNQEKGAERRPREGLIASFIPAIIL